MASKKDLKKDINFLTNEVIETCFLHYHLSQDKEEIKPVIDEIIEDAVNLRNELVFKINHPEDNLKGAELKNWYNEIQNQMLKKTDDAFEKLSELHK